MPCLNVKDGMSEKSYQLKGERTTVGRSDSADIFISASGVSSLHFEIVKTDGAYYIKDLDSTRGTMLNNVQLKPGIASRLSANDCIKAGSVEILFLTEEKADTFEFEKYFNIIKSVNTLPPSELAEKILESMAKSLESVQAFIIIRETDTGLFIPRHVYPKTTDEYRISFTVINESYKKREVVYFEDIKKQGMNLSESILRFDLSSLLCIPVEYLGECRGLFYFVFDTPCKKYNSLLKYFEYLVSLTAFILVSSESTVKEEEPDIPSFSGDMETVELTISSAVKTIFSGIQVEITSDKTKAFILVEKGTQPYPDPVIMEESLRDAGIRAGILPEVLEEMYERKLYDTFICVAREKTVEPVKVIKPLTSGNIFQQAISSDTFKSFKIAEVRKNQQLAELKLNSDVQVALVDGTIVTKKVYDSEDIDFACGKNCVLKKDHVFSDVNGVMFVRNKRIYAHPVLQVNGYEESAPENIDYNGFVTISGIAFKGMNIIAERAVELQESSNATTIVSRNDSIVINGTHYGSKTSKVLSAWNIEAKSVKESFLFAKNSIFVDLIIYDSNAVCNGSLIAGKDIDFYNQLEVAQAASDKLGLISGGLYQAGILIAAVNVGSVSSIRTELVLNKAESLKRIQKEIERLEEKIAKYTENFNILRQSVPKIKRAYSELNKLPIGQKETILKFVSCFVEMAYKIDDYKETLYKIIKLKKEISAATSKVVVGGNLYGGTIITIDGLSYEAPKNLNGVEIFLDNRRFVVKSLYS